ncbi:MAG TPA: M1 family aminopeptidase [Terracidiphilus sp.]|nr:M1 family aminopeptidase [Terracidiphilus sp.]
MRNLSLAVPELAVPETDQPIASPAHPSAAHHPARRPARCAAAFCAVLALTLVAVAPAAAQFARSQQLKITGYDITAELDTTAHHISAVANVTFTAPPDADEVTFGFHPALKIAGITDDQGKTLSAERLADGSIRVTPASPFVAGQPNHWTFTYDGTLNGAEDGPIEGLKLAAIQEPVTYLLYAARWFPTVGYMTDRFTAAMHIRVPQGMRVFASGSTGNSHPVTLASGKPGDEYDFNWTRPSFPGTVIAGRYLGPFSGGIGNVKVWLTLAHQSDGNSFAQTAASEYDFFTEDFGQAETTRLNVVEIPNDTLPAAYAPELAAIMGAHIGDKSGIRLLANTIAHQWWGLEVSPQTLNDAWITNGMSRYGELMYLENQDGENALKNALTDVSAGALAYDTIPLSSAGRLAPFSPQFQSMTLEKGAMIFHMLRGEIGDNAFLATLKGALSQYTDSSITTADFEKVAEEHSQQQLLPFFSQWVNGTGAPTFADKYSVYRLGNNKGFRTIGDISQDLDLFNMPVDLRIETDGKTVNQKIDVVGTDSQYVVDTFGRPRRISIDPNDWVLKSTPDLKVRIDILKGQQLVAQCDLIDAIKAYQQALVVNPQSSLASYRIGEALFDQRNFQASVNAYRDALRGDDDPPWTEVWSHISIGKIFDITGQRDRAVNEYRLAVQTNDNTQGAINEARMLLSKPFKLPPTSTCQ